MATPRVKPPALSFEEWLAKQGVTGKNENTSVLNQARNRAVINYLFKMSSQAEKFLKDNKLEIPLADASVKEVVFVDRLSQLHAIPIDQKNHDKLLGTYLLYVNDECESRPFRDIEKQIQHLDDRIKLLEGANRQKLKQRIDKIHSLATNVTQGWRSHQALLAYYHTLQNYLALNRDILSVSEQKTLESLAQFIMPSDEDISSGFIQDFLLSYSMKDKKPGKAAVSRHLVEGGVHQQMSINDDESKIVIENAPQKQPRFYPDKDGKSETDQIYFLGGEQDHHTIVRISKVPMDEKNERADRDVAHHWNYYLTEFNAGSGSDWVEKPRINPHTNRPTTGISWVIDTHQIMPSFCFLLPDQLGEYVEKGIFLPEYPAVNKPVYRYAMLDSLVGLVLQYKKLKEKPVDDAAQARKNLLIPKFLGPRIENLSMKGSPQLSGNCTVMSQFVFGTEWLGVLAHEHWRHIKNFDYDKLLVELKLKQRILTLNLATLKKKQQEEIRNIVSGLEAKQVLFNPQTTSSRPAPSSNKTPIPKK